SEDTTPPVTKIRGVTGLAGFMAPAARWKATFYRMGRPRRTGWTGRPRFTMGSFARAARGPRRSPTLQETNEPLRRSRHRGPFRARSGQAQAGDVHRHLAPQPPCP